MRLIPSRYWVRVWYGKTRMAGQQSREGRMMIDSVISAHYVNVSDKHTASHRSNRRSNALRRLAKIIGLVE